jgi:hypothetical protein
MAVSTAKSILRSYRKEGRIGPKITRAKVTNFGISNNMKPVRNKYIISYKKEKPFYSMADITYHYNLSDSLNWKEFPQTVS